MLKAEVELAGLTFSERVSRFVRAATDESPGPVDGPFRLAKRLLEHDPALARADVYTALVMGDAAMVRRQIERDPEWVRRGNGPHEAREPLLYVTFSKFHREAPEIAEGLLETARLLLDHGADPNAAFPDAWEQGPLRPLYGACGVANFPAMAEFLLDRGAIIDDNESLYHSLEHGDTRCLELLLARGAEPKGTNALNHAFDVFDARGLERVRRLLDQGADPNEAREGGEGTPLHVAIQKGRERAILELLVERGADVHARREDGRTPYQVAMQHGHGEAADYLVALGAATEASPFEQFAGACGRGDLAAARRVAEEHPGLFENLSDPDRRAFLRLAEMGQAGIIAALVDGGFPVNATGPARQTALHWASWHGWREAVEVLLARGASVHAVEDDYGATPLGWAAHGSANWPNPQGDYPGVVRLLLAAGADATLPGIVSDDPDVADLLRAAGEPEGPDD